MINQVLLTLTSEVHQQIKLKKLLRATNGQILISEHQTSLLTKTPGTKDRTIRICLILTDLKRVQSSLVL